MFKHSKTYIAIPPGATIKEMIDERGITQAELAVRLGEDEAFVRQLIAGEVHLTEELAKRIEAVMDIPVYFLMNLETLYREDLVKVAQENDLEEKRKAKKIARKAKAAKRKTAMPSFQAGIATLS